MEGWNHPKEALPFGLKEASFPEAMRGTREEPVALWLLGYHLLVRSRGTSHRIPSPPLNIVVFSLIWFPLFRWSGTSSGQILEHLVYFHCRGLGHWSFHCRMLSSFSPSPFHSYHPSFASITIHPNRETERNMEALHRHVIGTLMRGSPKEWNMSYF